MISMSFKKAIALILPLLAFNANAASKDQLVQQCRDLSSTVASLVSSQQKKACVEKLGMASMNFDVAGDLIVDDYYQAARNELDSAILSLQYAELNSCNRYIQISHSKLEAQRIKNDL